MACAPNKWSILFSLYISVEQTPHLVLIKSSQLFFHVWLPERSLSHQHCQGPRCPEWQHRDIWVLSKKSKRCLLTTKKSRLWWLLDLVASFFQCTLLSLHWAILRRKNSYSMQIEKLPHWRLIYSGRSWSMWMLLVVVAIHGLQLSHPTFWHPG